MPKVYRNRIYKRMSDQERQRRIQEHTKISGAKYRAKKSGYVKAAMLARWEMLKLECLKAYGGDTPRCYCCGESEPMFLTLEHLDDNGKEHRDTLQKKTHFYQYLRNQNYPKNYRMVVACWNCNCGRRVNGSNVCPHQSVVRKSEILDVMRQEYNIKPRQGGRKAKIVIPSDAPNALPDSILPPKSHNLSFDFDSMPQ